jgi:hypothetical protein
MTGSDFRKRPDPDPDPTKISSKFLLEIFLAEIHALKSIFMNQTEISKVTYGTGTVFRALTHTQKVDTVPV